MSAEPPADSHVWSEEKFRALTLHSGDIISLLDAQGRLLYNSPAAERISGFTLQELAGADTFQLVHPDDRDAVAQAFQGVLANPGTPFTVQYRYRTKAGGWTWMEAVARNELDNPEVRGVVAVSRDVSERKRAEEERARLERELAERRERELTQRRRTEQALRAASDRFSQALRAARAGAWEWDMLTGVATWSAENYLVLGLDPEGEQASYRLWLSCVHPGDRAAAESAVARSVAQRADLDTEFRVVHPGGEVRWVRDVGRMVFAEDGTPRAMFGIQLDVSDRRRAEEARAEAEEGLRHAQKMEAIGQLAGGLAHDFNNLLVGILGYAEVLGGPDPPVAEAAQAIRQAGQRAAELTRQLLGFARGGKYQPMAVDLHALVGEVVALLSRTLDKGIAVQATLPLPGPVVRGDPGQLHQVVLNLAVNARDAMPRGGVLALDTRVVTLTQAETRALTGLAPGRYVALGVRDNGIGIPRTLLGRVFEPFFTTKAPGRGSGMGLAMVYGIVRNHHGAVRVESEEGEGTRVTVFLPVADGAVEGPHPSGAPRKGTGRVLVVDDEPLARQAACRMLHRLGYEPVEAAGAGEAVELQRRSPARAALIDLAMPEADGPECLRRLREVTPDLRAILASGYGAEGRVQEALARGFEGFLPKPYSLAELGEAIGRAARGEANAGSGTGAERDESP